MLTEQDYILPGIGDPTFEHSSKITWSGYIAIGFSLVDILFGISDQLVHYFAYLKVKKELGALNWEFPLLSDIYENYADKYNYFN